MYYYGTLSGGEKKVWMDWYQQQQILQVTALVSVSDMEKVIWRTFQTDLSSTFSSLKDKESRKTPYLWLKVSIIHF